METLNIALPATMKEFIQAQVTLGGYSSASEYLRDLIRSDQRRKVKEALEAELLKGLHSGEAIVMIDEDWDSLKQEVAQRLISGNENGSLLAKVSNKEDLADGCLPQFHL
ncbi:MAG: type II toxin-antitoxin system ParD family antitoxin [Symploca sp. SIO2E6]|nr:type II toxin-antitoxin system ParD family antitoxin [Symploca sp. SIO2E6]